MHPTVRSMMDPSTFAVPSEMPILEAIDVLIKQGVTGVPVIGDTGEALGVLSEEHCLKLIAEGDANAEAPKGRVATFFDASVPQVSPDIDLYYVAGMFLRDLKSRRFPVVENGKLIGVITRKDVLRALRDQLRK